MKRRAFFGLMGGAAVAGPGMAKQAVASTINDLSLSGVVGVPTHSPPSPFGNAAMAGGPLDGVTRLMQLQRELGTMIGRSAEQHAKDRAAMTITALDPDLAAMRSLSLCAKISIQRRREYARRLEQERGWLQRRIDNLMAGEDEWAA